MTEHRMLDFVRALVVAEPDVIAPSVAPVRFQVRTGFIAPPKEQMRKTNYKVLVWKYRVKNLKDFADFLNRWEKDFSDWFHLQAQQQGYVPDKDPSKLDPAQLVIAQSYLGTFPARSPGAAAINRFDTAWGGTLDRLTVIERCRVAIAGQLLGPDEVALAQRLTELLDYVSGDVDVEILDPSIGF
jgi:hypothetical protein